MEPASATVEARSPSRRTSSSGEAPTKAASPRPAQYTKQDEKPARRTPKTAAASCGDGRVDGDLAGQHDLLERARADPLDRALDGGLVVLGRRDARDPEAPGGRRVEQRQLRRAQAGEPRLDPRDDVVGRSSGAASAATVSRTSRPRRASATSGTTSPPGPNPAQCGAVGAAAGRTGSRRRRRARRRAARRAGRRPPRRRSRRHDSATELKRSAPASSRTTAPSVASAARVAVGLLEAEPVVARAARGEDDGARVDRRVDADGQRGDDRRVRAGAHAGRHARSAAATPPGPRRRARSRGRGCACRGPPLQGRDRGQSDAAKATGPVSHVSTVRPLRRIAAVTCRVPLTPPAVNCPSMRTR